MHEIRRYDQAPTSGFIRDALGSISPQPQSTASISSASVELPVPLFYRPRAAGATRSASQRASSKSYNVSARQTQNRRPESAISHPSCDFFRATSNNNTNTNSHLGATPRPFYVFTRESYGLMIYCLQQAASPRLTEIAAADTDNCLPIKRWKRLQGNLCVIPATEAARPTLIPTWMEHVLVWRTCTHKLSIVPFEDWREVFRRIHMPVDEYGVVRHVKIQKCLDQMVKYFQYRRSRCGLTVDDFRNMYSSCTCQQYSEILEEDYDNTRMSIGSTDVEEDRHHCAGAGTIGASTDETLAHAQEVHYPAGGYAICPSTPHALVSYDYEMDGDSYGSPASFTQSPIYETHRHVDLDSANGSRCSNSNSSSKNNNKKCKNNQKRSRSGNRGCSENSNEDEEKRTYEDSCTCVTDEDGSNHNYPSMSPPSGVSGGNLPAHWAPMHSVSVQNSAQMRLSKYGRSTSSASGQSQFQLQQKINQQVHQHQNQHHNHHKQPGQDSALSRGIVDKVYSSKRNMLPSRRAEVIRPPSRAGRSGWPIIPEKMMIPHTIIRSPMLYPHSYTSNQRFTQTAHQQQQQQQQQLQNQHHHHHYPTQNQHLTTPLQDAHANQQHQNQHHQQQQPLIQHHDYNQYNNRNYTPLQNRRKMRQNSSPSCTRRQNSLEQLRARESRCDRPILAPLHHHQMGSVSPDPQAPRTPHSLPPLRSILAEFMT